MHHVGAFVRLSILGKMPVFPNSAKFPFSAKFTLFLNSEKFPLLAKPQLSALPHPDRINTLSYVPSIFHLQRAEAPLLDG